jgi:hypothetical protein
MADMFGNFCTDEVALTAATTRTVLQLLTAANRRTRIVGFGVFFDGTSSTNEPVVVELVRQTSAGTMSAGTAVKTRVVAETLQNTVTHSATVEPTSTDVLERVNVHPQSGYEVRYPLGQEPVVAASTRVGVRCTAPAGVNVVAKIFWEE